MQGNKLFPLNEDKVNMAAFKKTKLHSFLVATIEYFSQEFNWFLVTKTIYEYCIRSRFSPLARNNTRLVLLYFHFTSTVSSCLQKLTCSRKELHNPFTEVKGAIRCLFCLLNLAKERVIRWRRFLCVFWPYLFLLFISEIDLF